MAIPGLSFTSTKLQATQTASQSTSVAASPVVSINLGQGTSNPSGGGGATASAPATASPVFGGDTLTPFATPSFSSLIPAAAVPKTNDISLPPGGLAGAKTTAGLFDDPLILIALGGAALLFIFAGRKGR